MSYVMPPPSPPSLPVAGEAARFPVRRIYCVGRNYAAHAREMGADAREPPFFFGKPADALVPGGGDVPYPPATSALHHELELVVALAHGGRDVDAGSARALVYGYGVGIDLTRRDLQAHARQRGQPWDMAKGFDRSAPVSALVPVARAGAFDPTRGRIRLEVNGAIRQEGDLADMIWSVDEVLAALSRLVALAPGDLVFTGTPEGVAALVPGDTAVAHVDALPTSLSLRITPAG